jgi:hypothetical protein
VIHFDKKICYGNISKFHAIIRKTENGDIEGTLVNESYGFAIDFNGIGQMLFSLEELFDYVKFPQATHKSRSFNEIAKNGGGVFPSSLRMATSKEMQKENIYFILHVQFRHHSTWQGTITWIGENRIKKFRSQLEMIRFITEKAG